MIIVTGAAGFIGGQLLLSLRKAGYHSLLGVDNFKNLSPARNLMHLEGIEQLERDIFLPWLQRRAKKVEFIFHIGARTDTREQDIRILQSLNTSYSKQLFSICTKEQIPVVYASSAATYGNGSLGFSDDEALLSQLRPLNPYAHSKHAFDLWVMKQSQRPYFYAGLKFFNVYGAGESHKGYMASVVYHAYQEILANGTLELFKSYHQEYANGKQLRDFVYVKDVVAICLFFMRNRRYSGIYNVGTGKARSFLDLAKVVFGALGRSPSIRFIDIPYSIRDSYQYYTQADIRKLEQIGYKRFRSLEEGVTDYVQNYLSLREDSSY